MKEYICLLLPVLLPVAAGITILTVKGLRQNRKGLIALMLISLILESMLVLWAAVSGDRLTLWHITNSVAVELHIDGTGRLFAVLTAIIWLLVGIYSVSYMKHEHREHSFFGFYLIVLGVLMGLDFSGNLITMYLFYELMTLTSLPLVLHERTKDAVAAAYKYLFFSVAGAFLALFGIFFLMNAGGVSAFVPGGIPQIAAAASGGNGMILVAVFCMLVGFGVKAGMFPLHGWLPTAHPVAPAPASAVLSGLITKAGVLCIIRTVYYVAGTETIRGTWVQQLWILLTVFTVFMGSMLAYREPVLKKRLAYSTVSQVSYVLFGLSLLQSTAFVGALAHVVFHAVIKNALFLSAGSIIVTTGLTEVKEMRALGRKMPLLFVSYTMVSLGLIGIPPFSGFISKWYLAEGALSSGVAGWSVIGPMVLLLSALLTAGYLLPLTIQNFFPGTQEDAQELAPTLSRTPSPWMLVPIVILALATLVLGCLPGGLLSALEKLAATVL